MPRVSHIKRFFGLTVPEENCPSFANRTPSVLALTKFVYNRLELPILLLAPLCERGAIMQAVFVWRFKVLEETVPLSQRGTSAAEGVRENTGFAL